MSKAVLPRHVAIVMDGNGRWAQKQDLSRMVGHDAGIESARVVIETAYQQGIKVLSLFAFSTENWKRPDSEISHLMSLFVKVLQKKEVKELDSKNICLRVIGNIQQLGHEIIKQIQEVEMATKNNTAMTLVIAINYGGQWDIAQAACSMAQQVVDGKLSRQQICPEQFAKLLCLSDLPPVDLFIRTSGELRISNFFLWQLAYAELYFTEVLWPDFSRALFLQALKAFSERRRRFGQTTSDN